MIETIVYQRSVTADNDTPGGKNERLDWTSIALGTFGGLVGVISCHPLDTVKCRMQTQGYGGFPVRYHSGFDCLMRTFKEEGVRGLYKGVLPPLLMLGVINSVVFSTENVSSDYLHPRIQDNEWKEFMIGLYCGMVAGFTQSFVTVPMELVKLHTQHQKIGVAGKYRGNWATLQGIYRKGGIKGCFQGFWVTAFRDIPAFGVYFASYEGQMNFIAKKKGKSKDELTSTYPFICGGTAGILAWLFTYPVDLVKSRVQVDGADGRLRVHQNSWDCFMKAWKKGGVKLLYRGLTPTLVRTIASTSSVFITIVLLAPYFLDNV